MASGDYRSAGRALRREWERGVSAKNGVGRLLEGLVGPQEGVGEGVSAKNGVGRP
jgi:hypothetical protein